MGEKKLRDTTQTANAAYLNYRKKKINEGEPFVGFRDWMSKVLKSDVGSESGYRKAVRIARNKQ